MSIEEANELLTPELKAAFTVAKRGAFIKTVLGGVISGLISFGVFAFGLGVWKTDVKNDIEANRASIMRLQNNYDEEQRKDFDGRIFFLEDHTGFSKYHR